MKKLLAAMLFAGSLFAADFSVGIHIGPPPPPRVVHVRPVTPGPDYVWIEGYWYPVNGQYRWHDGYWTRPPYAGAIWVVPRHEGGQYYAGYWSGPRGRMEHDHAWDRDHKYRDYHDHH